MATQSDDLLTGGLASENVDALLTDGLAEGAQEEGGGGGATTLTAGDIALILAAEIEPGVTLLQALRVVIAVLAGDAAVTGATTAFKRQDGVTPALTISNDILGNRSGSTVGEV